MYERFLATYPASDGASPTGLGHDGVSADGRRTGLRREGLLRGPEGCRPVTETVGSEGWRIIATVGADGGPRQAWFTDADDFELLADERQWTVEWRPEWRTIPLPDVLDVVPPAVAVLLSQQRRIWLSAGYTDLSTPSCWVFEAPDGRERCRIDAPSAAGAGAAGPCWWKEWLDRGLPDPDRGWPRRLLAAGVRWGMRGTVTAGAYAGWSIEVEGDPDAGSYIVPFWTDGPPPEGYDDYVPTLLDLHDYFNDLAVAWPVEEEAGR